MSVRQAEGRRIRFADIWAWIALLSLVLMATTAHCQGDEPVAAVPRGLALLQELEGAVSGVIQRCERSVVSIVRTTVPPERLMAQGGQRRAQQIRGNIIIQGNRVLPRGFEPFQPAISVPTLASGAGVVIDKSGIILTQYRVVKLGDTHVVTDVDGNRYFATIRAADSRSGLAILAIDRPLNPVGKAGEAPPAIDLPALPIGKAEGLRKGRFVIAIGNPFSIESDGQPTVSWGSITNTALKAPADENLNDTKFVDGSYRTTLHHFGSLIQTDARLGWNASGGALVDLDGELVGIVTTAAAIAGHEQPAGYAIPLNEAMRRAVEAMRDGREPEYGLLGVGFERGVSTNPRTGRRGIQVTRAYRGVPAQRAGIRVGDLLLDVDGKPLPTTEALQLVVGSLPPGGGVPVRFERGNRVEETELSLGKAYIDQGQIVTRRPPAWRGLRVDFATAIPPLVLGERARDGHLDEKGCVVVSEVERGSVSWESGVRPYSFISHVGGQRVATPDEFYEAVDQAVKQAGENVKLKFTIPLPAPVDGPPVAAG